MIFTEWLTEKWFDIFFAIVLAFIFAIVAHKIYKKIKPEPKLLLGETIHKSSDSEILAKLILQDKKEIRITENEKIFGREDFVGVIPAADLQFIGRRHFMITKKTDKSGKSEWYIKDLGTKNGTKLDGNDIKKEEGLLHNAIISVADAVNLTFKVSSTN